MYMFYNMSAKAAAEKKAAEKEAKAEKAPEKQPAKTQNVRKTQKPVQREKMKTVEFKPKNDFGESVTVVKSDSDNSIRSGSKVVKVIDTRIQQNVNLSKYDERLEEIAGAKGQKDYGKSKQKIKNKNRRPVQSSKRED